MFADMKSMVMKAWHEHYALLAINCMNLESAHAAIRVAEKNRAPIILNLYQGHLAHFPAPVAAAVVKTLAESASVPVTLALDHGKNPDCIRQAFRAGFSGLMIDAFNNSELETTNLFKTFIELEKENYRYQETKWTVKEVLVHIIECERIFAYRALRFSRRDATALMGFDENEYIPNSNTSSREISKILLEYLIVRKSSTLQYQYFTDEMLDFKGTSNQLSVNARELGWMIAGHNRHHLNVLKERYL